MLFDDNAAGGGKLPYSSKSWTAEEAPDQFSAVCITAVLALAGSVLSLLCLVNRSLWPIPALTLAAVFAAFWRIHRSEGRLTGLGLARLALALVLVPVTAMPIQRSLYNRQLIAQARAFFPLVIKAAQEGDTVALSQFLKFQTSRQTVTNETEYWKNQFNDQMGSISAQMLVRNPVLVALAHLGENASVTYDRTVGIGYSSKYDFDQICCLYAVTYSEHNAKKTFFIRLDGVRTRDKKNHTALWKCERYPSKPIPLAGKSE